MILLLARRKVGLLVPGLSMSKYKNHLDLNEWYKNHSIFNMEKTTPMTKEKHEGLHDTSKYTSDFRVVIDKDVPSVKQKNYEAVKEAIRETVATYLTSDWSKEEDNLSPVEFFNAVKEAVMEEANWYNKHTKRCNDLISMLFGHRPINFE